MGMPRYAAQRRLRECASVEVSPLNRFDLERDSMKKLAALIITGALGLAACGGDDEGGDVTIAETPLAGKIGGQAWTFAQGQTNDFLSEGEDNFFAELYSSTFEACGFDSPTGNNLLGRVPRVAGDFELSLSQNFTFVIDGDTPNNLIATRGLLRVDEVTDTTITGGLHAIYDGDNEVDGTFSLTICVDDQPGT
jgi:hypothetical protein